MSLLDRVAALGKTTNKRCRGRLLQGHDYNFVTPENGFRWGDSAIHEQRKSSRRGRMARRAMSGMDHQRVSSLGPSRRSPPCIDLPVQHGRSGTRLSDKRCLQRERLDPAHAARAYGGSDGMEDVLINEHGRFTCWQYVGQAWLRGQMQLRPHRVAQFGEPASYVRIAANHQSPSTSMPCSANHVLRNS